MDLKERKLDVSKFEAASRLFVHIYFKQMIFKAAFAYRM